MRGHRFHIQRFIPLHQTIQGEHIRHRGSLLQADKHVVAKQQMIAYPHNIPRNAVIVGTHPGTADNVQFRRTKLFQALLIELVGQRLKLITLIRQAFSDDFVSGALGNR